MAPSCTGTARPAERGCLPDSAIRLWQSFDSPVLLLECLWTEDPDLPGSEAEGAAGPSGGTGREGLRPGPGWSSMEAVEPPSSMRS